MNARFATAVLIGLTLSAAAPKKHVDAAAAIRAADQEWARVFAAKDLERSVGVCAEKGSVLAPNAPRATGRDAIRQLFLGFFSLPNLSISWTPTDVRVARSGEIGYTTGTYEMSFKDPSGKTVPDHGKYGTVLEKQRDGSWQVVLDVFNTDLPLPMP